jgi:hypothetical protein
MARTKKGGSSARDPFAFAADLPAAYRELEAALAAAKALPTFNPITTRDELPSLSACSLWNKADEYVAAFERVGAAARRVHVAKVGRSTAMRTDGFVRPVRGTP